MLHSQPLVFKKFWLLLLSVLGLIIFSAQGSCQQDLLVADYQAASDTTLANQIYLVATEEVQDTLSFDLMARDLQNVFGIAIKMHFDPTRMQPLTTEVTDLWQEAEKKSLRLATADKNGTIDLAITHVGPHADPISGTQKIGHLSFKLLTPGSAQLNFEKVATMAIDPDFISLQTQFVGGTVEIRKK